MNYLFQFYINYLDIINDEVYEDTELVESFPVTILDEEIDKIHKTLTALVYDNYRYNIIKTHSQTSLLIVELQRVTKSKDRINLEFVNQSRQKILDYFEKFKNGEIDITNNVDITPLKEKGEIVQFDIFGITEDEFNLVLDFMSSHNLQVEIVTKHENRNEAGASGGFFIAVINFIGDLANLFTVHDFIKEHFFNLSTGILNNKTKTVMLKNSSEYLGIHIDQLRIHYFFNNENTHETNIILRDNYKFHGLIFDDQQNIKGYFSSTKDSEIHSNLFYNESNS